MARDYVAAGSRFSNPEYERVATLRTGAVRDTVKEAPKKPKTRVIGTAN